MFENYAFDPDLALRWFIGLGSAVTLFGFFLMIKLYRKEKKKLEMPSILPVVHENCCGNIDSGRVTIEPDLSWMNNPKVIKIQGAQGTMYKSDIIATVIKNRFEPESVGLNPNKPKPKRKPKKRKQ